MLSYDFAKQCFYRAWRERRCAGVLMTFPELRQVISADEGERLWARSEKLHERGRIRRTWQDPKLGTVELLLEDRG